MVDTGFLFSATKSFFININQTFYLFHDVLFLIIMPSFCA
ncbi:Putative uncharacterized protein [Moritella viscosa]|uniref:Uncharacterized protein n=1 Tax=Moritella viscosa TaxID=80854 RepID=A0A1L0B9Z6_9GAMM|nr:Putative uncharacterized protein [Moritella viscosa]SGY98822.1 Putative uncharacterized protein [Moritella viscosa]SGZ05214.1 Putative uncharacterized protein [Moritella viscosa]SGZ05487.1 Putative uncharacterized protein [Moritella viscosa]SHO08580.1 Putative uncharacterized protein [Moritella viscosa]